MDGPGISNRGKVELVVQTLEIHNETRGLSRTVISGIAIGCLVALVLLTVAVISISRELSLLRIRDVFLPHTFILAEGKIGKPGYLGNATCMTSAWFEGLKNPLTIQSKDLALHERVGLDDHWMTTPWSPWKLYVSGIPSSSSSSSSSSFLSLVFTLWPGSEFGRAEKACAKLLCDLWLSLTKTLP
ncbi:hypothetical protein JD844_006112 [Phrynosoma platyrhinos]|uniref:Uncharacterized protein n=1 Tax=Phrynosoma platyrhinos TaxID=52577 RepID=A0ABQ7TPZ5_PHRPL|nr:hypothetical protein JD844_006112 [Phrynosoma platyrhinos]